jgi:iron(III) transport system substrate-binding protein
VPQFARRARLVLCLLLAPLFFAACRDDTPTVVIYTSRDQLYAEPVLQAFEAETGIRVEAIYDTGATKTVGLVNRLLEERARPQADVFWSSDTGRTVVLQQAGVLAPYLSPETESIPAAFKDPDGYWTGFGARARVIIYNTDLVSRAEAPRSIYDLTDERWRGQVALGTLYLGTMATHHTALYLNLGPERARKWLEGLIANDVRIVVGNTAVRDMVSQGAMAVGLIDSSDAYEAMADGMPVDIVYPDQYGLGAMLIPNTVALVAGGPHPDAGRALIDYLLRPETEAALAASRSAQIPLHPGVAVPAGVLSLDEIRAMDVDYVAIGEAMEGVCAELARLALP